MRRLLIIFICLACVNTTPALGSVFSGNLPSFIGQRTECFTEPGLCGYPDPGFKNVGALQTCSSLVSSGGIKLETPGERAEGLNITGAIYINAENVIVKNDCISTVGDLAGARNIQITAFGAHATISHVTAKGKNTTTEAVQLGITNDENDPGVIVSYAYLSNCGECLHGAMELTNSYVTSNAEIPSEHTEDWYFDNATITAKHNTLINPEGQTANIFGNTNGGLGGIATNRLIIENNLFAGGGYSIYAQSSSTEAGSSMMRVRHNHFARCLGTREHTEFGGFICKGGTDAYGYFPDGGFYGTDAYTYCPPIAGQEWKENVWDNNLAEVACQ
jgi:hypothetical protein